MAAVWELQYKLSSDSTWTTLTSSLSSSIFYFNQFSGLVNGYSYDGRIRLVTDGVAGEWAEIFTLVYVDNTGILSVNNVVVSSPVSSALTLHAVHSLALSSVVVSAPVVSAVSDSVKVLFSIANQTFTPVVSLVALDGTQVLLLGDFVSGSPVTSSVVLTVYNGTLVVFDFVSSSYVVSDITFSTFSSYLSFTIDCFSYGDFSVLLESSGSFGLSLSTSIGATTELVTGA